MCFIDIFCWNSLGIFPETCVWMEACPLTAPETLWQTSSCRRRTAVSRYCSEFPFFPFPLICCSSASISPSISPHLCLPLLCWSAYHLVWGGDLIGHLQPISLIANNWESRGISQKLSVTTFVSLPRSVIKARRLIFLGGHHRPHEMRHKLLMLRMFSRHVCGSEHSVTAVESEPHILTDNRDRSTFLFILSQVFLMRKQNHTNGPVNNCCCLVLSCCRQSFIAKIS